MFARRMPAPAQPKPNVPPAKERLALGGLFFASGALALVYEMLWFRHFQILFGSAATASAAILMAFFAGLGLGNWAVGRRAGRWRNPWLAYALLEAAIALGALAVAPLLSNFASVHSQLAASASFGGALLLLAKVLFGFAAIALPTFAMGGTLPVLAELVDRAKEDPGRRVGWLYLVNTSGAALGALAFPFLLLPAFGMRNTGLFCAGANLLVAAIAFGFSRRPASFGAAAPPLPSLPVPARGGLAQPMPFAFLSGAGTFALQVLWNRAFAQIHENSLAAFSLIVALFIVAIALGAGIARLVLERGARTARALAALWAAGGALVLASPFLFVRLSRNLEYLPELGWNSRPILLAMAVILLPVALLSAGLPLLLQDAIAQSRRSTGDRAGALLAANIAGSILGALLAGFLLPKTLGLWNSAIAAGLAFLAAAACARFREWRPRAIAAASLAVLGGLLFTLELPRTRIDAANGDRLLALQEGAHGVVAVTERGASRRLKLNNHYVLGGTSALGDERMQAHIPLLLHPALRSAAFLGFGTGITAGGASFHPGLFAAGIELVPEVARFATQWFAEANGGFGSNSVSTLIVADARDHLRVASAKFDVIVGDLVVPWRPGESSLYTREHFAAAKRALEPGGLCCVWLPMFQLSETRFKIVLNTFLAEFDRAWVWRGDFSPTEPALALIGFDRAGFSPQSVAERLAMMRPDPSNPQLKYPAALWMHLVGHLERSQLDLAETRQNTENRPWLEIRERGGTLSPFVGRPLQAWEEKLRNDSRTELERTLPPEALRGWHAGRAMLRFTLATSERQPGQARAAQAEILQLLGPEPFQAIFGGPPP